MNVSELSSSNYLSRKELGEGVGLLLTVRGVEHENIAGDGQPENMKYIMFFHEQEKGLVMNKTNGKLMEAITGSGESDDWVGKKVVVYHDPSIMYKGEVKGGVRVRKPLVKTPAKPATKTPPQPPVDEAPVGMVGPEADVSDMPF